MTKEAERAVSQRLKDEILAEFIDERGRDCVSFDRQTMSDIYHDVKALEEEKAADGLLERLAAKIEGMKKQRDKPVEEMTFLEGVAEGARYSAFDDVLKLLQEEGGAKE